jgi:hypothetical protein
MGRTRFRPASARFPSTDAEIDILDLYFVALHDLLLPTFRDVNGNLSGSVPAKCRAARKRKCRYGWVRFGDARCYSAAARSITGGVAAVCQDCSTGSTSLA